MKTGDGGGLYKQSFSEKRLVRVFVFKLHYYITKHAALPYGVSRRLAYSFLHIKSLIHRLQFVSVAVAKRAET